MICEKAIIPQVIETSTLTPTTRADNVFASKETTTTPGTTNYTSAPPPANNGNPIHIIPFDTEDNHTPQAPIQN